MLKFLTSVEGIAMIVIIVAIMAGAINELIYFNSICKRTMKGYEDLAKDFEKLTK